MGYIYTVRPGSESNSYWSNRLEEEKEECQAREQLFEKGYEFNAIKYLHWFTALEHYYSYLQDKTNGSDAKTQLKRTIHDPYFRTAIPYMIRTGTKDMAIAGLCLRLGSYKLYKNAMNVIMKSRKL